MIKNALENCLAMRRMILENNYRQIMGQVLFLNLEYEKQLASIPDKNRLDISYEALCENTVEELGKFYQKLNTISKVQGNTSISGRNILHSNVLNIPLDIQQKFTEAYSWLINSNPELNL